MSFIKPNKVSKNENKREIKIEYMLDYYNEYLRNLVLRMFDDNNEIRPNAREALDELIMIEKYLENTEENESIKFELEKRKNLGTNKIKKSLSQKISSNKTSNNNNNNNNNNNWNNKGNQNTVVFGQNNINNFNNQNFNRNLTTINSYNNTFYPNNYLYYPYPYIMNMNLNNFKQKNTSLIRALQCLCGCLDDIGPIDSLQFIIKDWYKYRNIQKSLTLDILDILSQSFDPDFNYIDLVQNLRNEINKNPILSLVRQLSPIEELSPNYVFYFIFNTINDEYKNNNIPYNSLYFQNYIK